MPILDQKTASGRVYYRGDTVDAPLRLNQQRILWLTPVKDAAIRYGDPYYHKGSVAYLWTVTIKPGAKIVDFSDLSVPVIRKIKDAVDGRWAMSMGAVPDEGWSKIADFGLIEMYPWIRGMLKAARVDGLFLGDNVNGMAHKSLALFTLGAVESATVESYAHDRTRPVGWEKGASASDGKKTGDRTGVGFFIPLPKEHAEKFPDLGEHDASASHVTFLHIGSIPAEDEQRFLDVSSRVFSELRGPVTAHMEPIEYFVHPDKERRVAVVPYRFSHDLAGIRWKLRDALMEAGFKVDDSFPLVFRPHSTLQYLPNLEDKFKGPVPEGSWDFNGIEVWGLPKVHEVPFGESAETRIASKHVEGMTNQASHALMKFLSAVARKLGASEHIYVAGGAVRNFVLGQPIKDIDVVVDEVSLGEGRGSDWFARKLREEIPTETSHVTNQYNVAILHIKGDWEVGGVNLRGEDIEIANARSESYTEGGYKPTTVVPATIQQDVFRRELTFNSLLWRLKDLAHGPDLASIIDLTGCGLKDLKEGVARCPQDPDKTFSDDPSRLCRIVKFTIKYGFHIPPEVEASIRRNAQKLWNIPAGHLSNMLITTFFEAGIGKKALLEMKRLGLLSVIHDIAQKDKAFRQALAHWADSRADIHFFFDLLDLGMPTGRRLSVFSPQEKNRIREITVQMTPEESDTFVNVLEQPGKLLDMPGLIDEYGLKGPDIKRITDAARSALLVNPVLAASPAHLTKIVKEKMGTGKTAGILEPPPAMVESVWKWVRSLIAGHVLANVDEKLATEVRPEKSAERALVEVVKLKDALPSIIEKLGPGETYKFQLPPVADRKPWSLVIQRTPGSYYEIREDSGGRKHKWLERSVSFTQQRAEYLVQAVLGDVRWGKDNAVTPPDGLVVEWNLCRHECLKYTSKAKHYGKVGQAFPVDLTGWKYATAEQAKKITEEFSRIQVTLRFSESGGNWWNRVMQELQLTTGDLSYVNTLPEFKDTLEYVRRSLEHEMRHVGQMALRALVGGEFEGGLPPKALRDKEHSVGGNPLSFGGDLQEHALRDIEFYTDLAESVSVFLKILPKIPKDQVRDAFDIFTGLSTARFGHVLTSPHNPLTVYGHFDAWKSKAPGKWRKAVKEFIKELGKHGVHIGGGSAVSVARRYLTAAIFQYPPAMYKDIEPWMLEVYCSSVLAHVESRLAATNPALPEADKALEEMRAALAALPRKIKALKGDQSVRVRLYFLFGSGVLKKGDVVGVEKTKWYITPEGTTAIVAYEHDPEKVIREKGYRPLFNIGTGKGKVDYVQSRFTEEQVIEWAQQKVQEAITKLEEHKAFFKERLFRAPSDKALVEMHLLRKECLKHTSVAKKYTAQAAKIFPVDLTGWSYISRGGALIKKINEEIAQENKKKHEQIEVAEKTFSLALKGYEAGISGDEETYDKVLTELHKDWLPQGHFPRYPAWDERELRRAIREKVRPKEPMVWTYEVGREPVSKMKAALRPLIGPQDLIQALNARNLGKISAILSFTQHTKRGGQWRPFDRELQVDTPFSGSYPENLDVLVMGIHRIQSVLKHELQHLGQTLLEVMTQVNKDKQHTLGLPSKGVRDTEHDPDGLPVSHSKGDRQPHALRDVEFYPRFEDEINKFKEEIRGTPKDKWSNLFKTWVDLTMSPLERRGFPSEFFLMLKKSQPAKWKKAVKEFLKALEGEGVHLTGGVPKIAKTAGIFEGPPAMLRPIFEWVRGLIAMREWAFASDSLKLYLSTPDLAGSLDVITGYRSVIQEAKKYADVSHARDIRKLNRISQKFPLDLTGWKYAQDVEMSDPTLKKWGGGIKVALTFASHSYGGMWKSETLTLEVAVPIFPNQDFSKVLALTEQKVRHELQHLGQDLLSDLKGLGGKAGLPSRELHDEVRPQDRDKFHALLDSEFYTDLADAANAFLVGLKGVPKEDYRNYFRVFIGATPPVDKQLGEPQRWFKMWKEKAPAKWQRAVTELLKFVGRHGIHLPSEASKIAKTFTFNEGDPVFYGKWKNKPGKIKDFKRDERSGDPIVVIEPDPKGQKDDKEVKLLKIRERKTASLAGFLSGVARADDEDFLGDAVENLLWSWIKTLVEDADSKFIPYSAKGESIRYAENKRFSTAITYPDTIALRWVLKLDPVKYWERAQRDPSVQKYIKSGGILPPLRGPLLADVLGILKDSFGVNGPGYIKNYDSVSPKMAEALSEWVDRKGLIDEDTDEVFEDGDRTPAEVSPKVDWRFHFIGSPEIKTTLQGSLLAFQVDAKVSMDPFEVYLPGTTGWARFAAQKSGSSAEKVARRFLASDTPPEYTKLYVERLLARAKQPDPQWGTEAAPPELEKVLRYLKKGENWMIPLDIEGLFGRLEARGVPSWELEALHKVPVPRTHVVVPKVDEDVLGKMLDLTGLSLVISGRDREPEHNAEMRCWLNAFQVMRSRFPKVWHILKKHARKLVIDTHGWGSEDAAWENPALRIRLKGSKGGKANPRVCLGWLVHELGHAFEDEYDILSLMNTYGTNHPPFVTSYAAKNASEDFAETFASYWLEPSILKRKVPAKYEDMRARLSGLTVEASLGGRVAHRFLFADDDNIKVIDFVRGYKQISGVRRIPVARNMDPKTKKEQVIIGNAEIDRLGLRIQGKDYLTDQQMEKLFQGEVVIEEKVDGHSVVVLHGGYTFFCESLRIQHTVSYDDVPYSQMGWPDMTVVFEIMEGEKAPPYHYGEGTGKWLSRSEKEALCQMVGAPLVPLVYKGHTTPEKLPALADRLSVFSSNKAEGVVIKNLHTGVFGKFINLEFQKSIADEATWGGVHPELKGIRNIRKHASGTVSVLLDVEGTRRFREKYPGFKHSLVIGKFMAPVSLYRVFDQEERNHLIHGGGYISGGTYAVKAEREIGASWSGSLHDALEFGTGWKSRGRLKGTLYIAEIDGNHKLFSHLDPQIDPPFEQAAANDPPLAKMQVERCSGGLGCSVAAVQVSAVKAWYRVGENGHPEKVSFHDLQEDAEKSLSREILGSAVPSDIFFYKGTREPIRPGDYVSLQQYPKGVVKGWVTVGKHTILWRDVENQRDYPVPDLSVVDAEGEIYSGPKVTWKKLKVQVPPPSHILHKRAALNPKYEKLVIEKEGVELGSFVVPKTSIPYIIDGVGVERVADTHRAKVIVASRYLGASQLDSLQPNDMVTIYHGTSYKGFAQMANGVDALKEVGRLFGGTPGKGLFVTTTLSVAERFSYYNQIVMVMRVRAKFLHGTDWDGNIQDKNDHLWENRYPKSFRPSLSEGLLKGGAEPQAVFLGYLKPSDILHVIVDGKGMSRVEAIEVVAQKNQRDIQVKNYGIDLTSPRLSLKDFAAAMSKHMHGSAERRTPEGFIQEFRDYIKSMGPEKVYDWLTSGEGWGVEVGEKAARNLLSQAQFQHSGKTPSSKISAMDLRGKEIIASCKEDEKEAEFSPNQGQWNNQWDLMKASSEGRYPDMPRALQIVVHKALRAGYQIKQLTEVEGLPVLLLHPKVEQPGIPRVLVLGGVHGNEQSGFGACLKMLNDPPTSVSMSFIPAVNPVGLLRNTREDAAGKDPNRGMTKGKPSPEGESLKQHADLIKHLGAHGMLTLHEFDDDNFDTNGFYVYLTEHKQNPDVLKDKLLAAGSHFFQPIKKSEDDKALGNTIREGFVYKPKHDGTIEDWLYTDEEVPVTVVTEVPTKAPWERRVQCNLSFIQTFADTVALMYSNQGSGMPKKAFQKPFGYLQTLDMYDCKEGIADDLDSCYEFLEKLVDKLDMHKQSPPYIFRSDNEKYPDKAGLSGWIPLIESGIQLHTLTKKNFITVDVYSCREWEPKDVEEFARKWFEPKGIETAFIPRGTQYFSKGAGKVAARYLKAATEKLATLFHVYHGTNAEWFDAFDPAKQGTATDRGRLGKGFYFSTDPNIGRGNKTLIKAQVQLRKPLHVVFPKWEANKSEVVSSALGLTRVVQGEALTQALRAKGYDGVILDYSPVGYHHQEIMVFDPRQIQVMPKTAAARYKNKKTMKNKDGEESTVYEYSDRQVAYRNNQKAKRVEKLRGKLDGLRAQVKKDLLSDGGSDD